MSSKEFILRGIRNAGKSYKRCKFKGLFNYFLCLIDGALRLPFSFAKPVGLDITIIEGICNLSCKMCFPMLPAQKRELSFLEFKRILDACKYVTRLNIYGWGESFMVKDIFKMIAYAKAQNCEVGTVTNMSLINETAARSLIESQLDYLAISFDAARPELFEEIRQGSKFENIVNNIKILSRLKQEYRSENPQLSFMVTAMKENISEIPGIIGLAHQLGIKKVAINPLRVFGRGLAVEEQSLTNFPALRQENFAAASKRAEELGISLACPDYRRHYSVCNQPWHTLNVLMDGTIRVCCSYFLPLGNIFKDGINNTWNNRNFRLMRKVIRKENSLCHWCLPALHKRFQGWITY